MKKNSIFSSLLSFLVKRGYYFTRPGKFSLVLFGVLFCYCVSAQNLPPASSCTSGDLLLVAATLPPNTNDPICGDCISGTPTSRTMYLSINNKTGSQRTSFAFWGVVKIYNADGSLKSSAPISRCGGPIEPSMINKIDVGTISYICGESIQLTNLFLAWTTSNKKETCDWLLANPSTINPKCGVLPSINVFTGLDADIETSPATCISGGSIKVSPGAGKPNYMVTLGNTTRSVDAYGSTTFLNLPAGTYSVKITDANGCIKTKANIIVGSSTGVTANAGSPFTITCIDNINGKQIGENAVNGFTYSWSSNPTGFTSNVANPTVNPSETTTYTVVKTNSSTGCIANASVTVTVNTATPSVTGIGGAFTKTCTDNINGGEIGETAVSGFNYSWSSNPVGFTSATANPTVNPLVTTEYTVRKTNSSTGCFADASVTVTVNTATPSVAGIGGAFTKTCTANINGGAIGEAQVNGFSYSWSSSPAGFSSAEANPTVNPSVTTLYTVRKTNDVSGCFADASVTVTVNTATPSVAGIGGAFAKTCTANTNGAAIGEAAVNGFSYTWSSIPSGFTSALANPTVNPSVTTEYTVRKTNSSTGCFADASVTVTVNTATPSVAGIGGAFTKTCTANTNGGAIGETAVNGFSYSWSSSPAGFNSALANPTVNPSVTTVYTVRKTNTATGCFADASVTVTVTTATPSVAGIGGAFTKTCTANTSGGAIGETAVNGFSYSWSSSPAGFSSATANPTVNPSVTTVYTVRKTNDASGCFADASVTVTVTTATPSVAGIGGAFTKTCTANTSGGAIGETAVNGFSYSWSSSPAGFSSAIANPTVNPSVTTVYTVRKTNDASGCFADASVTVTVNTATPSVAGIGGAFTKTCTANTNGAAIGEIAVNGFSYSWSSNPAGYSSAIANPTVNPSITTVYTVRKTNTTNGCFADASVTVTVTTATPSVAGIGGAFTKTCTANTSGGAIGETAVNGFSYSWSSSPAGFSSAIANPTVNPSVTTVYTVRKTNTNTGCFADASVTVTVNNTAPTFTVCLVAPTLCANSGSVTINASGGSGFSYTINGTDFSNTTGVFTGLGSGSVTSIQVKNSDGCISGTADCNTTSVCGGAGNVTNNTTPGSVNPESAISAVDVSKRGGISSENVRATETIIARIDAQSNVMATPNPYTDKIRFALQSAVSGPGTLELFTMNGQKIKTIFQGYVFAGKGQTIEYIVPSTQSKNIVYVFTVAGQKTTGTLIGMK